jgi:hypothetical protein
MSSSTQTSEASGMSGSRKLLLIAIGALALSLAAVAVAVPMSRSGSRTTTIVRPGMMGGFGGMVGSGYGSVAPRGRVSAGDLSTVRNQVERWLNARGLTGFHVSEVMAFANNDYVAVRDATGRPAFELLTAPGSGWLMEEPPSMMWNSRYGMMRGYGRNWSGMRSMMGGYGYTRPNSWNGWYRGGHERVSSIAQAARIADRWLAQARPGELAETDGRAFPGYFTLDTTRNGKTNGMLSVNASSGAVWYHGWHGTFRAERQF